MISMKFSVLVDPQGTDIRSWTPSGFHFLPKEVGSKQLWNNFNDGFVIFLRKRHNLGLDGSLGKFFRVRLDRNYLLPPCEPGLPSIVEVKTRCNINIGGQVELSTTSTRTVSFDGNWRLPVWGRRTTGTCMLWLSDVSSCTSPLR